MSNATATAPARNANNAITGQTSSSTSIFGSSAHVRMGVADEALVLSMLSNLSSDPAVYTLRELWSNAVDAQRRAGNLDKDHPIRVDIDADSKSGSSTLVERLIGGTRNDGLATLTVTDQGCGMSRSELENVYLQYGGSDKRSDVDAIGSKGLGAKAPLALADGFCVRTTKAGITSTAVITRPEGGVPEALVTSEETGLSSGTTVIVPFTDPDGHRSSSMRKYADGILDLLEEPILSVNGCTPRAGLAKRVERGELVPWSPADGITIYEDVSSNAVMSPATSNGVIGLDTPDVDFDEPGKDQYYRWSYHSTNLSTAYVSIYGEGYALPHLSSALSGPVGATAIVVLEPGYLDFDPSRDNVMDDETTRNFESWLQRRLYDHMSEDGNPCEKARIANDHRIWQDCVRGVEREDGAWHVTYQRHNMHAPATVTFQDGEPIADMLSAADELAHGAHAVYTDVLGSSVFEFAEPGAAISSKRTGVTRSTLKNLDFDDIDGRISRLSDDERVANAMSRLFYLSRKWADIVSGIHDGGKTRLLAVIPETMLRRCVNAHPCQMFVITVKQDMAWCESFAKAHPSLFLDPANFEADIAEREEERRAERKARVAERKTRARTTKAQPVALGKADQAALKRRLATAMHYHGSDGNYSSGYDEPIDDVAIDTILIRDGSINKGDRYWTSKQIGEQLEAIERALFADAMPTVSVCTVKAKELDEIAKVPSIRVVDTFGFSDSTLKRVTLTPSPLTGLVRKQEWSSVLEVSAKGLADAWGTEACLHALFAAGAMRLDASGWLARARNCATSLDLPSWVTDAMIDAYTCSVCAKATDVEDDVATVGALVERANRNWHGLAATSLVSAPYHSTSDSSDKDARKPTPAIDAVVKAVVSAIFEGCDA